MSLLRVGDDDHPEAAGKHLHDARQLLDAGRFDGAAYLSGYVLECSLKTLILHDQSFDSTAQEHDPGRLQQWHRTLSKRPYGHDLRSMLQLTLGPSGEKYELDFVPPNASALDWRETWRYAPAGFVSEPQARALFSWADLVYRHIVLQMQLDRLL